MKLTIFEMQALEFALRKAQSNLRPVYMDAAGNIFKGHFLVQKDGYLSIWELNFYRKKATLRDLDNKIRPNLFSRLMGSLDTNEVVHGTPVEAFNYFKSTYPHLTEQSDGSKSIVVDGSAYDFQELNYFFDFESKGTKLDFIDLPEPEYQLISFEQIETDNA